MTLERIVKQTVEVIQFDGANIKEVYDFICMHRGNANNITFEELLRNRRPEEIPLDVNTCLASYDMECNLKEKWSEVIEAWKDYRSDHPYEDMDDYEKGLPAEFVRDQRILSLYQQGWRPNELYHFYLTEGNFCRLIGICKGDWFTNDGEPVEHYSDGSFKSLYMDCGWKEAK